MEGLGMNKEAQKEQCCYGGIAHDCHAGVGCRIAERLLAEQPTPVQQEPVAEVVQAFSDLVAISWRHSGGRFPPVGTKLYTSPQPAQPLTDEQIEACIHHVDEDGIGLFAFARAIEAAHGITKGNT
jgi:hypothetical protein